MKITYRTIHILVTLALLFALLPTSAQAQTPLYIEAETGVTLLADIAPGTDYSMDDNGKRQAVALGNNVVFFASAPKYGLEPWITDGTPGGTRLIKDTFPGAVGVFREGPLNWIAEPVAWNGKVFFVGQKKDAYGNPVPQLWVTNGQASGTVPVSSATLNIKSLFNGITGWADFEAGPHGVMFQVTNDDFFTQEYQTELWWTDGTEQGTLLLYSWEGSDPPQGLSYGQLNNYAYAATPDQKLLKINRINPKYFVQLTDGVEKILGAANGLLFFTKYDPAAGTELWQTDGTTAGTVLVADLSPSIRNTTFVEFVVNGKTLAFIAKINTGYAIVQGVFTTSGKSGGVTALDQSSTVGYSSLQQQSGTLFFIRDGDLWYSTGPMQTLPICTSCFFIPKKGIGVVPGKFVFPAGQLWITDGTDAGTHQLTWNSKGQDNFVTTKDYVFFMGKDETYGKEPYVYRPADSSIIARHDTFTAMRDVSLKIDVLANDSSVNGKPLMLKKVESMTVNYGEAYIDDRGTPGDRTDDQLRYKPDFSEQVTKDELHYMIEDADGNTAIGRVSITIEELGPIPPEDIKYYSQKPLYENEPSIPKIGTLEILDHSPYDFEHSCVINTPDSPIEIVPSNETLNPVLGTNAPLDYESFPTGYVINVTCTDSDGLSLTKDVTVPVVNVNELPDLTVPAGLTMAEDGPQQELGQVSWTDPENNVNSVTATAANGSTKLVDCAGTACTLNYQPTAGFFGTDTITVKATDKGGLITEKVVTITVTAGNDDPPVMNPIAAIVRQNEIKEHQFPLSGIAAGPYEEGPVTIDVTTDNPAILVDLAVDYTSGSTGTLHFTLHPEEGREALVTITLSDGVNETEYTFKVLVTDNPPLFIPILSK